MNTFAITGNLASDPEVRFTADGRPVANFSIGNNERVGDRDISNGFFDVTVWGPQAEYVQDTITKGDRVVVVGRLQQSSFEREDGSKGYRQRLVANAVGLSLEFAPAVRPAPTQAAAEPAPVA